MGIGLPLAGIVEQLMVYLVSSYMCVAGDFACGVACGDYTLKDFPAAALHTLRMM
jgi:hypothetical protein